MVMEVSNGTTKAEEVRRRAQGREGCETQAVLARLEEARGQLRIDGAVLAAVGRGDERAARRRPARSAGSGPAAAPGRR